ncbi:MAG: hypothetical protein EAZ27_03215 [Cytophagales bacterium]|nr:MAG: hypothetical protein EAZ27_03215 [Cytophagales bacterium]
MNVNATAKFIEQANKQTIENQIKIKEIINRMYLAKNIFEIEHESLVGYPYLYKVNLGIFSICFEITKCEIELIGIVPTGNELTLFF